MTEDLDSAALPDQNFLEMGGKRRGLVHLRARELAILAGFATPYVRQRDYEQAKREITGHSDVGRQNEVLDQRPLIGRSAPAPSFREKDSLVRECA